MSYLRMAFAFPTPSLSGRARTRQKRGDERRRVSGAEYRFSRGGTTPGVRAALQPSCIKTDEGGSETSIIIISIVIIKIMVLIFVRNNIGRKVE